MDFPLTLHGKASPRTAASGLRKAGAGGSRRAAALHNDKMPFIARLMTLAAATATVASADSDSLALGSMALLAGLTGCAEARERVTKWTARTVAVQHSSGRTLGPLPISSLCS